MTSTFSTNKGLEEPASGDYVNAWATPVNSNWTAIDVALGGTTTISVTGNSTLTTTLTQTQYRPPNIEFTGTLSTNLNYQIPTGVGGMWSINNATTGLFLLGFSIASGNTLILPPGRTLIISNGTSVSYASPTTLSLITSQFIGETIYPETQTEINLSYAPTIFIPVLRFDPVRYGATGSGNPADSAADTLGLNEAILRAIADRGEVWLGDNRHYTVPAGALAYTAAGNRGSSSLRIVGSGWNGTSITQLGGTGAMLSFTGQTPTGDPNESPMWLENFSLNGTNKSVIGVLLDGVAMWNLHNLQLSSFGAGIKLNSALLGLISGCQSGNNNFGLLALTDGTGSACNQVVVRDSEFNLNTTQGIYLGSGSDWLLDGLQVEANGTTGDRTTGAIRIASTIDDEFGSALVEIRSCHLEGNLGQPFQVDNTSGLFLAVRSTEMLAGENNFELRCQGAADLLLENIITEANGIIDITANLATLNNVQCGTLLDTGVVYPIYNGVRKISGMQASGRATTASLNLTGVISFTPIVVQFYQQGQDVTAVVTTGFLGTSNSISATITGIPLNLCPVSGTISINLTVTNNSITQGMNGALDPTGVLTLNWNGSSAGFMGTGNKGIPSQSFRWRIV